LHFQVQNLARFAFGEHLEWPAADLAIGGKPLRCRAGVHHQFKPLTAIRTLNGFADFHLRSF